MKYLMALLLIGMACLGAQAQDTTSADAPVDISSSYCGGVGVGAMSALNEKLREESKAFFELAFINDAALTRNLRLFFDVSWLIPGPNFGADIGVNYLLLKGNFRPFVGAGLGVRYFDKEKYNFGNNFGSSMTLNAGVLFDITKRMRVRVRVPYFLTFNHTNDQTMGIEVGVLFSNAYHDLARLVNQQ